MKVTARFFASLVLGASIGSSEVARALDGPCIIPDDGLVAWYPADGNADDVANGNDATLRNGASFGEGILGQAFVLDGNNDDVAAPNTSAIDVVAGGTLAAWIKMTVLPSQAGHAFQIIGKGSAGNDFDLHIHTDDKAYFYVGDGDFVASQESLPAGTWVHVAGTWEPGIGMKIYVNGDKSQSNVDEPERSATGASLLIGNHAELGSRHFEGAIDEVMIFDRGINFGEAGDIACREQVCGDATNDRFVVAGDALVILKKSVGQNVPCPTYRCDTDGSDSVTASDALRALKTAVGQNVDLSCPTVDG